MKNILNQPMRSRMSRCFQRRKWESLFKKFKKKRAVSQANTISTIKEDRRS